MKSDSTPKTKRDANRRLAGARGSALTEMDERILRSLSLRGKDGMRFPSIMPMEEGVVVTRSIQRLVARELVEKVPNRHRDLVTWRVVQKAPND